MTKNISPIKSIPYIIYFFLLFIAYLTAYYFIIKILFHLTNFKTVEKNILLVLSLFYTSQLINYLYRLYIDLYTGDPFVRRYNRCKRFGHRNNILNNESTCTRCGLVVGRICICKTCDYPHRKESYSQLSNGEIK